MAEGAVDLVEEAVRQKDNRRKRHEKRDHGVVALAHGGIHQADRIVAPGRRRDTAVMQEMVLIEELGVQQPVGEIEPGVEEHHAEHEEGDGPPPAEVPGRKQGPSLVLDEKADRDRRAGHEDRGHALADFDGLALLAAPPLLNAALGVAVVEPGDAVAEDEVQRHRRCINHRQQADKGETVLKKGAQIVIRRGKKVDLARGLYQAPSPAQVIRL